MQNSGPKITRLVNVNMHVFMASHTAICKNVGVPT